MKNFLVLILLCGFIFANENVVDTQNTSENALETNAPLEAPMSQMENPSDINNADISQNEAIDSTNDSQNIANDENATDTQVASAPQPIEPQSSEPQPTTPQLMKIKLSFEGGEIIVILDENSVAKAFYDSLPLELEFSDFAGKEKIAMLNEKLNISGFSGYLPDTGDFFYYNVWGNVGIFYAEQPFNKYIVRLGKVQGGLDTIKAKRVNFKVNISKAE